MAKLEAEPRLQGLGLPAALIEWCRRVTQAVNPLIDAIGPVRVSATSISETLDGPAFHATLTSDVSGIVNSSSVLILGTEVFDTNGCYNPANGRFTPNVAGYYQVNFNVLFQFPIGGTNMHSSLQINGSESIRGTQNVPGTTTTQYFNSTGSTLVYMNGTTDYMNLVQTNSASSGGALVLGGYTQFSAHLARRA